MLSLTAYKLFPLNMLQHVLGIVKLHDMSLSLVTVKQFWSCPPVTSSNLLPLLARKVKKQLTFLPYISIKLSLYISIYRYIYLCIYIYIYIYMNATIEQQACIHLFPCVKNVFHIH